MNEEKSLTMNCIFMYNRSIYKVTIHLLFAMMSVAESKNIYQWRNVYRCVYFRVLFVLFLVGMITQLTCLLGLGYLPAAQAALMLKVTWIFSIIINVVYTIMGIIAIAGNESFLGIPLSLIIAVDSGITFVLLGISSLSSNVLPFIYCIVMGGIFIINGVVIGVVTLLRVFPPKEVDNLPYITFAFIICSGGLLGVMPMLLFMLLPYQKTLTHEQLYGFLIVPLVYYALKALGTGGLWIFGMFARSNNGEEESKGLLGNASMSTFRTFQKTGMST
jgi:hypothetical protein